jgi:nicotinate-nucleotide adenylyltransferase
MKKTAMRIGIFGGTFDPPHNGHYEIARRAKEQLCLSKVVFVPAYIPPHKQNTVATKAADRLNMLKLLVKGGKSFAISDVEIKRHGISYTVDTLAAFRRKYPAAEIMLIIGADNLAQLHSWKSPEKILQLASIAVYARKGFAGKEILRAARAIRLKGPLLAISSTKIRRRIAKGLSVAGFVSFPIRKYITQHGLYRCGSARRTEI